MNSQQIELYQRIQAFSLDQVDNPFPFSKRLARDNRWSQEFAHRVIEEYKKFTFLAVSADHPVTPSDQVDQVWHLHLSYTRSYWEEFCPQVLERSLHHDPTRGGEAEDQKFEDWYNRTLESYEQFFEQTPPTDIWPAANIRFGQDVQFVRVNTQRNWVLPKLLLIRGVIASIVIVLAVILAGFQVQQLHSLNPVTSIVVVAILIYAGINFTRFLAVAFTVMKNPRLHGDISYFEGIGGGFGCGGFGCGGCGGGCGGG